MIPAYKDNTKSPFVITDPETMAMILPTLKLLNIETTLSGLLLEEEITKEEASEILEESLDQLKIDPSESRLWLFLQERLIPGAYS